MRAAVAPGAGGIASGACDRCLARAWLLSALSGHLDRARSRIAELLALEDEELIAAVGGRRRAGLRRQLARFEAASARRAAAGAGLELICRCESEYPPRLRELPSAPAVLHVAGGASRLIAAVAGDPVAIVGARAASPYGAGVARSLARGLAAAGVSVISGLATGIDSAAHSGALAGEDAPTVAVLPGPANRAYPRANRRLHRRVTTVGSAISELPPGAQTRGWMFPARNRIIAALAAMTVVVEAGARSGALVTARFATGLGRPVGAVPGQLTAPQARGTNALLRDGALLIRGAQDVLDVLFEAGTRTAPEDQRPPLPPELSSLLGAIGRGEDTLGALDRSGIPGRRGLAALAALELAGYIQRGAGGRYIVVP